MKYKLFFTPMCPKCPKIKEFLNGVEKVEGEFIDATTKEGLEQARELKVSNVPTAVFFEEGKEISRAHDIEEVKRIVENKQLGS
ncbi:hypothetical protein GF336_01150 [Candidatus Woesearchaeota archaeon]|nr:hypothetical protein [Candidatus Woesearchaeota archaeon]